MTFTTLISVIRKYRMLPLVATVETTCNYELNETNGISYFTYFTLVPLRVKDPQLFLNTFDMLKMDQ